VHVLRASFIGELSYEISVPADFGEAFWDHLLAAGQVSAITSFGLEALPLMRTEKGYLYVGTDTNGSTVPNDIGMAKPSRAGAGTSSASDRSRSPKTLDPTGWNSSACAASATKQHSLPAHTW
jgi:hypothetical protein